MLLSVPSALGQVFILYPGLSQASLSVFACYKVDDGSPPYPEMQRVR